MSLDFPKCLEELPDAAPEPPSSPPPAPPPERVTPRESEDRDSEYETPDTIWNRMIEYVMDDHDFKATIMKEMVAKDGPVASAHRGKKRKVTFGPDVDLTIVRCNASLAVRMSRKLKQKRQHQPRQPDEQQRRRKIRKRAKLPRLRRLASPVDEARASFEKALLLREELQAERMREAERVSGDAGANAATQCVQDSDSDSDDPWCPIELTKAFLASC